MGPDEPRHGRVRRSALRVPASIVVVTSLVAVAVPIRLDAVEVPPVTEPYFFQTSGRSAGIGIGDYYTSVGGAATDHEIVIRVPCTPAALPPIVIDLFDPELNAAGNTPFALDEVRSGVADDATYTLFDPLGNQLHTKRYPTVPAGADPPTDNTWVNFTTINPAVTGCGDYLLNTFTGSTTDLSVPVNDDDNSWRLRVNYNTGTDDADNIPGTGDELLVGFNRMSLQHGADATSHLYFFVGKSLVGTTIQLHNFDLDGGGTVNFVKPDGSSFGGTLSANASWNGGPLGPPPTRVGDPYLVTAADVGWWRSEVTVGPGNQYIMENIQGLPNFPLPAIGGAPGTPELTIAKDDGVDTVQTGDTLTYTIDVTNVSAGNTDPGPGPAYNVTVTDTLPTGFDFVSCVAPAGGSCSESSPGVVTFDVPTIPAGTPNPTETMSVTVDVTAAAGAGPKVNTATVAYEDVYGDAPLDVVATDTDTMLAAVDLTISKDDGGAFPAPGAAFAYTLTYDQLGTEDLTGVVISEIVPVNTTFDAAASTPGWSCADASPAGTPCAFTVGAVAAADGPAAVQFAVRPDDPYAAGSPDISNTATIADDGTIAPDAVPANNSASTLTPVDAAPQLVVTKVDTAGGETPAVTPVPAGGTISYVVTVTNTGNLASTATTFSDTPTGPVTVVAASVTTDTGSVTSNGPSLVAVDIGSLAGGASAVISYDVLVDSPIPAGQNTVVNQGLVTNAEGDSVSTDDPSVGGTSDANVVPLDATTTLDVAKTASPSGAVAPGDTISYTIVATNTGTSPLTAITASDPIPIGTTYVAATGTVDGNVAFEDFASGGYTAGYGWVGNWQEFDDDASSSAGGGTTTCEPGNGHDICVLADGGSNRLRVENDDNGGYRQVDLSDATSAELAYDYRVTSLDTVDEWVAVYAKTGSAPTNASRGIELVRYAGPLDQGAYSAQSPLDLTPFVGNADVYISFAGNIGAMDNDDGAFFDDVAVTAVRTNSDPPVLTPTPIVLPGDSVTYRFDVVVDDPLDPAVTQIANQATVDSSETSPQVASAINPVITPTLVVTKADSYALTADANPGDTIAYTVDITNTATVAAVGVTFADSPDPNTALVVGSVTTTAGTVTSGNGGGDTTVGVALGTIPPGATRQITFDVVVDDPIAPGVTTVANQGTVSADRIADVPTDDPETATADDATLTNIAAAPDVTLTKTDSIATPVTPGDTITYTLVVSNGGNTAATNVVVDDAAPPGTTFVDSSVTTTGGTIDQGDDPGETTVAVDIGTLAASSSVTITFQVTVDDPAPAGLTEISNQATVTSTEGGTLDSDDPDTAAPGDPTVAPLTAGATLTVAKTDSPDPVLPGGDITYAITYGNTGNQVASGVELTETVPALTVFRPGPSSPGWSCTPDNTAGSTCVLTVGDLTPAGPTSGSATFVVTVDPVVPSPSTQISNTVVISGTGLPSADDSTVTDVDANPALVVDKADAPLAGPTVEPGEAIRYTITIDNSTGTAPATGVVFDDTPGAGSTLVATSVTTSAGTVTTGNTPGDTTVSVDIGTIAAGAVVTIEFDVTVTDPFPISPAVVSNQGTVASNELAPVPTDDPDTPASGDPTDTPINAAPDLAVTKVDSFTAPLEPGDTVGYTVTITNSGDAPATAVTFVDDVGAASAGLLTRSGAIVTSQGSALPLPNGVSWNVGTIPGGGSATVTFEATVVDPVPAGVTAVENQGVVQSSELPDVLTDDPTPPGSDDPTSSPLTAAPDVAVAKADNVAGAVGVGATIVYTVTVTNDGNQDATAVVLTDTVPVGTTFVAASSDPGWSCADGAPAGSICTLSHGALTGDGSPVDYAFGVQVDATAPSGLDDIVNDVAVSDPGDTNAANDTATETTPLDAEPVLSITKSDGVGGTVPGATDVYVVRVLNTGDQDATGIELTETVPANTTFDASASAPGWSCADGAPAGTPCTFTIPSLAATTGAQNVAFAVVVDDPVPSGVTQIANTATITAEGGNNGGTLPGPATDTNALTAAPDLTIAKTDGAATVAPGATVAYTITVTNIGNQASSGSTITDMVPANSTFDLAGSSSGWSCADDAPAGSVCTFALGTIAGDGASAGVTFAVTADAPMPAGVAELTNSTSVVDDGANGPEPTGNNNAGDTTPLAGGPDLVIGKDDGVVVATPGASLAYLITVDNIGSRGASGVTITETVPVGTTFDLAGSSSGWSCADGAVAGSTCDLVLGTVEVPDAAATVTFAVTVDATIASGVETVDNTATVADDGANGADPPGNNSAGDSDTLDAAPDLRITKSDGGATVTPGGTVTYSLLVENIGNQASAGSTVTDVVPAFTVFNDTNTVAVWSCADLSPPGTNCVSTLGAVPAGGSQTIDFVVTVDPTVPAGTTTISNSATVTDDGTNGADPDPSNDTDGETTPIDAAPVLAARKEDAFAPDLNPGETITYTITIDNTAGNTGATTVDLVDPVPAHTTLVGGSLTVPPDGTINSGSGAGDATVDVSFATIPAGETRVITFDVVVDDPVAADVTQISNQGTVTADGGISLPTDDPDNPASTTDPTITPLASNYDVELTKTDNAAVLTAGGTVVYEITVEAFGSQVASAVQITETVPAETAFDLASSSPGWSCGDGAVAGSTCTFDLGDRDTTDGPVTVDFGVRVPDPVPAGVESTSNTATVTAANAAPESQFTNNVDNEATPIVAAPDLVVVKTDDVAVAATVGQTVVYTLAVRNDGDQDAADVTLTETVPTGATFAAGASTVGWSCADGAPAGTVCTLGIGALGGGAAATPVDFGVVVDDPLGAGIEQLDNTARADDSSGEDATPADNETTIASPVAAEPALTISKTDGGVSAVPGTPLTYTISWSNAGDQATTGVVVTDLVPANTVFEATGSDARWSCTDGDPAGTPCTITVGALAGGAADSATFVVIPANPFPAGVTSLTNTASIADDGANGGTLPPDATEPTPVAASPMLSVAKTDSRPLSSSVPPGAVITYTIDIENNGNRIAANVNLVDAVPAHTTLVANSVTAPPGSTVNSGNATTDGVVDVDLPDLGTSTTHTVTFRVVVDSPLPAGVASVSNQATVTADGAADADSDDPETAAPDDATVTNVGAAPDLQVSKDDGGINAVPGDTVTYTVGYANVGNQTATNVEIEETVPIGATFVAGPDPWSCADGAPAGTTCTITFPVMTGSGGPGSSGTVAFTVLVDDPLQSGLIELDNDVSISDDGANGADPTPADNNADDQTPIVASPVIEATKTATAGPVAPGATVAYTVVIRNTGDQDDANVVFTDTPDANSPLVDGTVVVTPATAGTVTSGNGPGDTVVAVDLGTLAGGEAVTITFDVDVDNPFPGGITEIANQGFVDSDDLGAALPTDDPNVGPGTDDPTVTTVAASPTIRATKTYSSTDSPVVPGSVVDYEIVVSNTGTTSATAVVAIDDPDVNSSLVVGSVAISPASGGSVTAGNTPGDTAVEVDLNSLLVGEVVTVTFSVVVDDPIAAGVTQVSNQAVVSSAELPDVVSDDPAVSPGSSDPTITPVVAAPILALTKDDGLSVPTTPGATITYRLVLTNSGDTAATGVVVADSAPAGTSFVQGSVTTSTGVVDQGDDPGENTASVDVGTLPAGASATITFDVTVDSPVSVGREQLSNLASATSNELPPVTSTDLVSGGPTVTPLTAAPILQVTKTDGPDPVDPGADITYTIDYENTGDQSAGSVVLTETVPANTTFQPTGSDAWSCAPDASAGSTCTLPVGTLVPGAANGGSATFVVTTDATMPSSSTQILNTVDIDDASGLNADASTTTDVDALPAVTATKVDAPVTGGTVEPGENIVYTVEISNTGTAPATNVVFTDAPGAGSTLVATSVTTSGGSVTTGNTPGDTAVDVAVGSIAPGATVTITFEVTVANPYLTLADVTNQGRVTADDGIDVDTDDPDLPGPDDPTPTPINITPTLRVTKVDSFAVPLTPGDTVHYVVEIENIGDGLATGVTFDDDLAAQADLGLAGGVTTTQGTVTAGNGGGQLVSVDIGTITPGTTVTVEFDATVDSPFPAGTSSVSNQGVVDSTNAGTGLPTDDPDTPLADDPTQSPVTAAPDVAVAKVDDVLASASVGATVVYTISAWNIGDQTAASYTLTDVVPTGTTFDAAASSAGWSCADGDPAGTPCTWTGGALVPGGAVVDTLFAVDVIAPAASGLDDIGNTVAIDSPGDVTPGNNSADEITPLDAAPVLEITKDDGATSTSPGATDVYTLVLTNTGDQDATGIVITETVPTATTFDLAGSTAGWSCADDAPAGTSCTFTVPAIAAGGGTATVDFAVTVDSPVPAGTDEIVNTAQITAEDGNGGVLPGPVDDTNTLAASPALTIAKDDLGATTTPGVAVTYAVSWGNSGPQAATGVVITDTVPANTTFVAAGSDPRWSCSDGDPAGTVCTITAGPVASGASDSAAFVVEPVDPFPAGAFAVVNTASIADDGANGGTLPPDATDSTPVTAAPDIVVTKTDSIPLSSGTSPGSVVTYTIEIENTGDQIAAGVQLLDTVPANTRLVLNSVTAPPGSTVNSGNQPTDTAVDVDLPDLTTSGPVTVTFQVVVDSPLPAGVSTIANQAVVRATGVADVDSDDPETAAPDDPTVTNVAAAPDLAVAKTDGAVTATPGDQVTYTVDYANVGDQTATGVVITETVPIGSTFVAAALNPWSCAAGATGGTDCTLTISSVPASGPGSSGSVDFTVEVLGSFPAGQSELDNDVSITDDGANGADPTPADNAAADQTPVTASPSLSATKSADPGPVSPGTIVTYTVVVANSGDQADANVVFTDTPDPDSALTVGSVAVSPAAAGTVTVGNAPGDTTVTVDLGTLDGGETVTITFDVTVDTPFPNGDSEISNQGMVDSDDLGGPLPTDDPAVGGATDPTVTVVQAVPVIEASKVDSSADSPVVPGSVIGYSVIVTNTGTTAATGVAFTDTPGAHTTLVDGSVAVTPAASGLVTSGNGGGDTTVAVDLATVTVGEAVTITFDVVVDDPIAAGVAEVVNQGTVSSNELPDVPTDDPDQGPGTSDPTITPISASPIIAATKADSTSTNGAGRTVVAYTVVLTNSGDTAATNVSFLDVPGAHTTLEAGTVVVAPAAGAVVTSGNAGGDTDVAVDISTLAVGQPVTITFDVLVDEPLAAGVASVENQGVVTADGSISEPTDDPDTPGADDPTVTPVQFAPDLTVTKTDGGTSAPWGGTVVYTVTYDNVGRQDATGVVLTETVPANATFTTAGSTAGWACAPDATAGSTCTLTLGAVAVADAAQDVTFAVVTDNPVAAGETELANTVTIADDGANGADETPTDNTGADTTPILTPPDLRVAKSGPPTAEPGDTVTFALAYENTGQTAAVDVSLTETVPVGTVFDGAASTAGWSCTDGAAAGTVCTLDVGAVAGGASGSATFAVTVLTPSASGLAAIDNTASIANDDAAFPADPTPADNSDSWNVALVTVTIGDRIWVDANEDSIQQPSEGGAPNGTVVQLSVAGSGTVLAATTTGADGSYSFDGLGSGDYTVEVVPPAGYVAFAGSTVDRTVAPGATVDDADIPINARATIGDQVWIDANGDGIQQPSESSGPENVVLDLLDAAGDPVPDGAGGFVTTQTGVDGAYSFPDLLAGTYQVALDASTLPGGFAPTTPTNSGAIAVGPGAVHATADFGVNALGSVSGQVWVDADENGVNDTAETDGLGGLTIALLDAAGDPVPDGSGGLVTTTTDPDGNYSFGGLLAGTYRTAVTSALPGGFTQTTSLASGPVAVDVGEDVSGVDYGANRRGSIGDLVWYDLDGDTTRNGSEPGIAGITVRLLDGAGNPLPDGAGGFITTVTALDGSYLFPSLLAGDYQVEIDTADLPPNATFTTPATQPLPVTVPVAASATTVVDVDTADFGVRGDSSLGDAVFYDANGDGVQQPGETHGFPDATVQLLQNGVVIATATTDATGTYGFVDLLAGDYSVQLVATSISADAFVTTPEPITVSLGTSETDLSADIGVRGTGSIGDAVYIDANEDGSQAGPLEPGQSGVVVILSDATGAEIDRTTTTAAGNYLFANLPAGDYQVHVDEATLPTAPSGAPFAVVGGGTAADPVAITLAAGEAFTLADVGINARGTIGDQIYVDPDESGTQDPSETDGLGPVTIELLDADAGNAVVAQTVSDPNGFYDFTDVVAGNYVVAVVTGTLPAGYNLTGPPTRPVVIGVGETDLTVDFGVNNRSTISGGLFEDRDDSGSLDAGETVPGGGIGGVMVRLLDSAGDPVQSGGVDVTAVTAADGSYSFPDQLSGDYLVAIDAATLPPGLAITTPAPIPVALRADDETGVDFGAYKPATIGDLVWYDVNDDDLPTNDDLLAEPGVGGIDVVLYDGDPAGAGVEIARVTTAADGSYQFDDVHAGTYFVQLDGATLPAGSTPSFSDTTTVTVPFGGTVDSADFAITGTGSIGDQVFDDVDGDGFAGPGEPGRPGVTLTLTDGAGNVLATTTSGPGGAYTFPNIVAGDYTVEVTGNAPPGFTQTTADPLAVTVGPGEDVVTADIGFNQRGAIGDTVFVDANEDGVQDLSPGSLEVGQPGVTVRLFDDAGVQVGPAQTTAADGSYLFTNVLAGSYTVQVGALPAGYSLVPATPNDAPVTVGLGERVLDVDFGINRRSTVSGLVWIDWNGDKVLDAVEPGRLDGVTVHLLDLDGTPSLDSTGAPIVATTAVDGTYTFTDVLPGDHLVRVDLATLPTTPNYNLTTPNDTAIAVGVGEDVVGVDFGANSLGVIGDRVWYDSDGDGVHDAGEPGLDGVTINLLSAGVVVATTTTGGGGGYTFTNLAAGDYTVEVDLAALSLGAALTTSGTANVSLAAGAAELDADFGVTGTNSIGDRVWFSTNGDGVQDPGEPGQPGVTVYLLDDAGTTIDTQITGVDGTYLFDRLLGGTYSTRIEPTTLPPGVVPSSPVVIGPIVVLDGERVDTADFGVAGTNRIGDRIWFDVDGDGIQDAGEPGVAGVLVRLIDGGGAEIRPPIATGPNGSYSFVGLPTGTYTVEIVGGVPAGATATPTNPLTVTVADGDSILDRDVAIVGSGAINGAVFIDPNVDGARQPGENAGLAGIIVQLMIDGVVVDETTTGPGGAYSFDGLLAGDYVVRVDPDGASNGLPPGAFVTTAPLAVALAAGEVVDDVDLGVAGTATIGDLVFVDVNGDGVQAGALDTPQDGAVVVLLDAAGDEVARTTTGSTGTPGGYQFTAVVPGDYTVTVDPLSLPSANYTLTTVDPLPVTVADGEVVTTADLGINALGTIAGHVFVDADENGAQGGALEVDQAGVVIILRDDAGVEVDRTTTVADGSFAFADLRAGDYTLDIDPTTLPGDATVVTPPPAVITLPVDGAVSGIEIGINERGRIGNRVWVDIDGQGDQDLAETAGIAGVTVRLLAADLSPILDPGGAPVVATTDADGIYVFDGVLAGDYVVRLDSSTLPAGFVLTTPADRALALGVGVTDIDQDFGARAPGVIGDTVFHDLDGDGVQDPGEPGLAGIHLQLTDASGNPIGVTQISDGNGNYEFPDVFAGTYSVSVVSSRMPARAVVTAMPTVIDLTGGGSTDEADVGIAFGATIAGTVFVDPNVNGVLDASEPGAAGVTVTLFDANGVVVTSVLSDVDGTYEFTGVMPGTYTVEAFPVDVLPTGPTSAAVEVTSGTDVRDVDFGVIQPATLSGTVFFDDNDNSVRNPSESGTPGVVLELRDAAGNVVATTVSGPDGSYQFTAVPGPYTIVVDQASVPAGTRPTTPLAVSVVLGDGQTVGPDFGLVGTGRIGDTVFVDRDGDGVQDRGEPGVSGVPLKLIGADGVTLASGASGPDGMYFFLDLRAGTYTVVADGSRLPSGLALSGDGRATVILAAGADDFSADIPLTFVVDRPIPRAGSETRTLIRLGLLLLVLGGFLAVVTRRRDDEERDGPIVT